MRLVEFRGREAGSRAAAVGSDTRRRNEDEKAESIKEEIRTARTGQEPQTWRTIKQDTGQATYHRQNSVTY